jgi:amphiphysin
LNYLVILGKADPHKRAKLQIKFDAAAKEYSSHNELLKRELPMLFSHRKQLVTAIMLKYEAFMSEFFEVIPRILTCGNSAKSYAEIQAEFNRHEEMIHEILGGLSLVSMNARKSASAMGQLTNKIKSTFKKDSKITPLSNRTRSGSYAPNYTYTSSNQNIKGNIGKPAANDYLKNAMGEDKGSSIPNTRKSLRPTTQPNAKSVFPPQPPPAIKKQHVVALFDFTGSEDADLSFQTGDKIEILSKSSSEWWIGRLNGREGNFPSNYVKEI